MSVFLLEIGNNLTFAIVSSVFVFGLFYWMAAYRKYVEKRRRRAIRENRKYENLPHLDTRIGMF